MQRPRVLVVDDDDTLRELLSEVLTNWGYQVATAATARLALDLLQTQPFDVAISDIRMPEMDGIELLR